MTVPISPGTTIPGQTASPEKPLQVQAPQQVSLDDVSGFTPAVGVSGDPRSLLDKNRNTSITIAAGGGLPIVFRSPLLISRIGVLGTLANLTVTVIGIDGVATPVIVGAVNPTGADSGAFAAPILASQVNIGQGLVGSTLLQVIILKTIEIEGDVAVTVDSSNTPGEPIFVQEQGQIVNEEATITTGGAGFTTPTNTLDKIPGTTSVSAGAATITYTFGSPLLIGRIAVDGDVIGLTITAVLPDGTVVTLLTPAVTDTDGADTLNFEPQPFKSVTLTVAGATTLREVAILKAKEVKAAPNLTPVATSPYFSSGAAFVGGNTRYADGVAFTTPDAIGAVAARFVDVGKDQQPTITAQSRVVAGAAVTTFSIFLDWYFSFDGVTWFYGGSSVISDTAVAGNPTGFVAAAETSERAVAKPANIFGRFIAIVARHLSAAGTNSVTLTAVLNRQR